MNSKKKSLAITKKKFGGKLYFNKSTYMLICGIF